MDSPEIVSRIDAAARIQEFLSKNYNSRTDSEHKDALIFDILKLAKYIRQQCKSIKSQLAQNKVTSTCEVVSTINTVHIDERTPATSQRRESTGFNILLNKMLSPSIYSPARMTNEVSFNLSLPPSPIRQMPFPSSLNNQSMQDKALLSKHEKNVTDDDEEVFDLLRSVEDWSALRHYVKTDDDLSYSFDTQDQHLSKDDSCSSRSPTVDTGIQPPEKVMASILSTAEALSDRANRSDNVCAVDKIDVMTFSGGCIPVSTVGEREEHEYATEEEKKDVRSAADEDAVESRRLYHSSPHPFATGTSLFHIAASKPLFTVQPQPSIPGSEFVTVNKQVQKNQFQTEIETQLKISTRSDASKGDEPIGPEAAHRPHDRANAPRTSRSPPSTPHQSPAKVTPKLWMQDELIASPGGWGKHRKVQIISPPPNKMNFRQSLQMAIKCEIPAGPGVGIDDVANESFRHTMILPGHHPAADHHD